MTATPLSTPLRRNLPHVLWLLLVVVIFAISASWLDPALGWPMYAVDGAHLGLVAINILPFVLIVLLLGALTRRVVLSSWIGLLLLIASHAANTAKLQQLEMPLLPGDFHFLEEIGSALPLFVHYIGTSLQPVLIALGVLALTVALFREAAWPLMRGWKRLAVAAVSITLGVGIIQGWTPWRAVYSAERLRFEPWSVVDSARKAGMVGNLVLYNWELAKRQELHPDRNAARELLRANVDGLREHLSPNSSSLAMPSGTQPDIVIIQSESLFDPARLNGAPKNTYLPNFHRLAKRGLSGELKVPTYAGGTIRTEFEVLTGLALAFFPGVQYPYFEIADRPIPGIVRTLSRQGYQTTAIHPNSGVFWNRNQAYQQIGFDRFVDERAFSKDDIVGLFTGDAALTDHVLAQLDQDGPPQLIFAVTMENHGPFDWRPGLDAERLAAMQMPAGLDEGGEYWMRNYLYLLGDADHELGRLADALQKRKRRTLLLFYGDHLPALPPVYHQIGFADGKAAKTQPVPWLLLDNRRKLAEHGPMDTTAWLLPSILLETAGIGGDRYFATLAALRDSLPTDVMASSSGLPGELRALGQLRFRNELEPILDTVLDGPVAEADVAIAP
ncbi:LTA synthase family protein [Dokdonella sp.]|uniref:LTA synthase family protein n=1 Tax=Dokdonella sp. TaxID=2291710 RepID=UPI002C5D1666|nr:LTA synthase family protein [Xanthomonadales bacterium]HQV73789.1 LTA synthase family protein [Dokdonella sp.]MBK7209984.1 LTA synthase family protein [Xanthomonadales bacterium]HQX65439.1 LTA synthase family protein [Dokdonella sp.]HQY56083.1 LTA synthase family protein [Dokdonella sp.]